MSSIRLRTLAGRKPFLEVRVSIKGHKPESKTFAENEKRKAQRWANGREEELRSGSKVSRLPGKTTVAQVIEAFRNEHLVRDKDNNIKTDEGGKALSSLSTQKLASLRMVSHYIGDLTIEELTSKRVEKWLKLLARTPVPKQKRKHGKAHTLYKGDAERTYSASAIRKLFHALKLAVVWHAREHDYPIGDRFDGFKLPAAWSAPRERRLVDDEEARLLAACDGMYKDPEGWKLLIRLALATAMRAGELLGLRWEDVQTKKHFLIVPKAREKTKRGRTVPLSKEATAVIATLTKRRAKDDDRVFWTLSANTAVMGQSFKRITKRAGIEGLRFHDLRHEAISRLFERTQLRTLEIALMTGHSNLSTLQRYANLRPAFLAEQIDQERAATAVAF